MAHGVNDVISEGSSVKMVIGKNQQNVRKTVGVMGSRRIFAPAFKLKVLDSYRNDIDCRGNQRATARKYGIHRRQIQKWLQCEDNLRSSCPELGTTGGILKLEENTRSDIASTSPALNLSLARLHGDELPIPPPSHPPSRNSPLTTEFHVGYTEDIEKKYYPETGFREMYQLSYRYEESNYENVDTGITRAVLHAPAEIKAERVSPDSAATPGMYEMPESPSASFLPPQTTTNSPTHFEPTLPLYPYQTDKAPCCQENTKIEGEVEFKEDHPPHEGDYSGPSSPQGPVSSSRSTSSCSDSELDSTSYQPGDLNRRRSFSLLFKINVLDAFHRDVIVSGNQRATARKFGINRRQVQKWLGQEMELREEIARRGGNSQRLGSNPIEETPVDLRVAGPVYCCDTVPYLLHESASCTICTENPQYETTQGKYYSPELGTNQEFSSKRSASSLSCCYPMTPSPKKLCLESELPPQETPLCLVKPKIPAQIELVTSTVQSAPVISSTPSSKKDAILFKPYLDNPISKPNDDSNHHRSMINGNNNNNCQGICNLNEGRGYDYALELSLRVPVSWRTQHSSYCDIPHVRSAFVRYPASPHYT
ncbi:uncharacterized protein LOC127285219 [Leptopilina boulardi]|uniref:uncharacterized protein LOC127285219 n=1 Tax=Leptopilina boulardi TaxID=63433 RepID=UPI0021F58946|nr:uncharacterized protein LOC127285219 [Leptopilina boulardi]